MLVILEVGFLESELLRMGKGEQDISEMYIVRRNYEDKAVKYVRLNGSLNFAQGGSFADVIETLNEYGIVPDAAMPGLSYGESGHKHGEMADGLSGYINGIMKNGNKRTFYRLAKWLFRNIGCLFGSRETRKFHLPRQKLYTAKFCS